MCYTQKSTQHTFGRDLKCTKYTAQRIFTNWTRLCQETLCQEHSKYSSKSPCSPFQLRFPSQGGPPSCLLTVQFTFACFSTWCKWNHSLCSLLLSGFFHSILCLWDSPMLLCVTAVCHFSLCIAFFHCLSMLLLMGIWIVSSLVLLQMDTSVNTGEHRSMCVY